MKEKTRSLVALSELLKLGMGTRFLTVLIALAALCTYAVAEEVTAEDWLNRGQELMMNGSSGEALAAYDRAIKLIPVNSTQKLAEAWELKAFALANLGDVRGHDQALYEESIRAYDKAIELDPQRASARTGKAAVLTTRLNRADEALETSSSALDLSSNNTDDMEAQIRGLEVQGLSLVKSGKYEEANQTYDRLLKIAPQNSYAMSFAWQGKGNALAGMNRYEKAISAYDRAIETYPSSMDKLLSSGIWEGKGDALEAMGRHEEAIAAYDGAIDAHPKNAPVIYKKGRILEVSGRQAEADAAYAKAAELGYKMPSASSLAITNVVSVGEDEFIEMANDGNETQTFEGLILTIDESESVVLPNFALGPGERIRFHFGEGESNETDVFLKGDLTLDNVAGNLTLEDSAGTLDKFAAYWTPEETAEDWINRGQELYQNQSYQEALDAYDEGLKTDPQNASAWHYREMALAEIGRGVEANQSLQKAIEILDLKLQEDPEDLEAMWLRAEGMNLLGRSQEALESYGRVAESNSSHALGALIRESDILAALGRYNQSAEAFNRAMALVFSNQSQSQIEFQWHRENASMFTTGWIIDGQIHRVSTGLYNISSRSFDEIEQINSDYVAALQLKGSAADPGRHGGTLMGSSLNWDIYIFDLPEKTNLAGPTILSVSGINPKGDEFIGITNGLNETISLQNWSFEIQGSRVTLPGYSLQSGKSVRIHLGSGQGNETDLFLDSDLELNDMTGSVSLKDDSGEDVASLDYRTKLDGSIACSVTAYEYPGPGRGKIVQSFDG